jgi:hypothetical protein
VKPPTPDQTRRIIDMLDSAADYALAHHDKTLSHHIDVERSIEIGLKYPEVVGYAADLAALVETMLARGTRPSQPEGMIHITPVHNDHSRRGDR